MVSKSEIVERTIRAGYVRARDEIEEETRRRQEEWKRESGPDTTRTQQRGPPPSSVPMTSSTEARGAGSPPPSRSYSVAAKEEVGPLPSEVSWAGKVGKEPQKYEVETGVYRTRRLVYQSDFTVPTGWDEVDSDEIKVSRKNDYYHMVSSCWRSYCAYRDHPNLICDFRSQVDLIVESRGRQYIKCGIVFCSTNENSKREYCPYMDVGGFNRLCLVEKSNDEILFDFKLFKYIDSVYNINTLQMERRGQKISAWMNGYYLATVPVRCEGPGHVGLFVSGYADESYVEAKFRNGIE